MDARDSDQEPGSVTPRLEADPRCGHALPGPDRQSVRATLGEWQEKLAEQATLGPLHADTLRTRSAVMSSTHDAATRVRRCV